MSHRPVRSMTGYARVQHSSEWGEISIGIRSLNHRGLDLHFHLPPAFDAFENAMRTAIKEGVARGHLDIRATWTPSSPGAAVSMRRCFNRGWAHSGRPPRKSASAERSRI